MPSATPLKAVLLDNDGVLADTEHLYFVACRDTVAERGLTLTLAEYQEVSLRQGASTIDFAARGTLPAEELAALKRRRDEVYQAMLETSAQAREGAQAMLEALHGRVALAVVTAAHRPHFDAIHRRTGFARFFDFVLTQEDCPISKPSPAPYLAAMKRGGWAPGDCVVVEDTERGLAAARGAGIRCFAVPYGPSVGGAFHGAEAVLPTLKALTPRLLSLI